MARPGLPDRTRELLLRTSASLQARSFRFVALGTALTAVILLHAAVGDPGLAWATVPVLLLAGLAGTRSPLVIAGIAVAGHLAVDIVLGVTAEQIPGLVVRSVVLVGAALVGMAGQQAERQRGRAMNRAVLEDPITGLLNVRAFYDELGRLRAQQQPFTILLADIRGMRGLNERYGHPTGTEAMRALAHVLRRETGPEARASRLGSDEVAVALVGDDRDRTQEIVAGLVRRLRNETVSLPDGQRFEVHAAYGVARFPEDGTDEVGVLRAADRAKERAKLAGLDEVRQAGARED